MKVLGIDLGNKSRNSIVVMDETGVVLDYSRITYDKKKVTVWQHRKNICQQIRDYIEKYQLTQDDWIVFEKVNLFVGSHISKLNNIMSLAFLQATIINEFSECVSISEVNVRTWKSKVLNNPNAGKEESVKFVETYYPEVDLKVVIPHKRKGDEIIIDNDTADAVCIALYGQRVKAITLKETKVNFM